MERTLQVLVADDNAGVLAATGDLIGEYAGVEVVYLAANVEEAVGAAAEHRPDLAFVDAWLTGGGAALAAQRMKVASPSTKVIALASVKDLGLLSRLRAAGVASCYEKESIGAALPAILAARLLD